MTRSPAQRASLLAAVLFGAAPLCFGLLRAWRTHYDFRMFWTALIATVFAFSVLVAAIGRRRSRHAVLVQALAIFLISAMLAWGTGYALGAISGPGAWMVAVTQGLCLAAASIFVEFARPGRCGVRADPWQAASRWRSPRGSPPAIHGRRRRWRPASRAPRRLARLRRFAA